MIAIVASDRPGADAQVRNRKLSKTSGAHVVRPRRPAHGFTNDGSIDALLLQTVSHDLRSPIAAILMITGMLASDAQGIAPLSVEVRSALIASIRHSARQMDGLLTDILDSDPMRTVSDHHACDVGELVRRLLDETGLERDHPVETDLPCIYVDVNAVHLERIVENLLANAGKHVAPGVRIWVKAAAFNGGVLISVEDAGSGVDPKMAQSIFEPFRRGDGVQSTGSGLGLSLVYRFAALNGGSASVRERVGGGSSFRVFLPSRSGTVPAA